ncbi:hypothetical protein Hanom_Chr13g01238861 [Helianthus anomalus]
MVLVFQKYTCRLCYLHFITLLVSNFFQKYIDGSCGLQFVTHLVPNLNILKPLDSLTGN